MSADRFASSRSPVEEEIQKAYYSNTASNYNDAHLEGEVEHDLALAVLSAFLTKFHLRSVLDVGSGTGRALFELEKLCPDIAVQGIEPVKSLREVAYQNGINREKLIEGDARRLPFPNRHFDIVCEFGVLHHVKEPALVIAEMLRVARHSIFLSDCNNFGNGAVGKRIMKQLLRGIGLWPVASYVKTHGRGYTISEGDGLAYSYSVYDSFPQIRKFCSQIHIMNTRGVGVSPFRTASHVALFAIKDL